MNNKNKQKKTKHNDKYFRQIFPKHKKVKNHD